METKRKILVVLALSLFLVVLIIGQVTKSPFILVLMFIMLLGTADAKMKSRKVVFQ